MTANSALLDPIKLPKETNIIQFPKHKIINNKLPEKIMENLFDMKLSAIEDACSFIMPTLMEAYEMAGFTIVDDRKILLAINLIRASMFDHFDIWHPLDDFCNEHAEAIDEIINEESIGNLAQEE